MNVLVSINRGYLRHFKVMLYSLLSNAQERLSVYVLHNDLDKADEAEIVKTFPLTDFNFIFMDETLCKGFPKVKRYPYTIYYRIFAPLILPESVERILYLDSDLVVHNSLSEFYNSDFNGNLFVACSHTGKFLTVFNRIRLGVGKGYYYMNTGVMLMDVKSLRKELSIDAIREFTIKKKAVLALYDQDILFRFYGNRIKLENSLVYNLSDRQMKAHNVFNRNKIDERWVKENNAVIHYIGRNKPWNAVYRGKLGKYYTETALELFGAEKVNK